MANSNKSNKRTFVRITNKDIYKKVCDMHDDIIKINGRTKINKLIASLALFLALAAIGIKYII